MPPTGAHLCPRTVPLHHTTQTGTSAWGPKSAFHMEYGFQSEGQGTSCTSACWDPFHRGASETWVVKGFLGLHTASSAVGQVPVQAQPHHHHRVPVLPPLKEATRPGLCGFPGPLGGVCSCRDRAASPLSAGQDRAPAPTLGSCPQGPQGAGYWLSGPPPRSPHQGLLLAGRAHVIYSSAPPESCWLTDVSFKQLNYHKIHPKR